MNFCDECETCAHCLKQGCIPTTAESPLPDSGPLWSLVKSNSDGVIVSEYLGHVKRALAARTHPVPTTTKETV